MFVIFLFLLVNGIVSSLFVEGQVCISGSVRLVDEANYTAFTRYGRLEICQSGIWQTVCADDTLCTPTAKVVCRQLGFSTTGVQVYGLALFGEGNSSVGFENIVCLGTETNITQCNYTTPSTCSHSMDTGVICNPPAICLDIGGHSDCCDIYHCYIAYPYFCWCDETCHELGDCCPGIEFTCPSSNIGESRDTMAIVGSTPCSTVGEIRFDDGGDTIGRVLVCDSDYRWKTICNEAFDEMEAKVICRSLGLSTANFTIYNKTEFGQGIEDIYSKALQCHGNESRLTDCPSYNVCCGHHRDVGISCQSSCSTGEIRLVGSTNDMEGRVEVCYQGRWGTICDTNWETVDAQIVCKTIGLPWRGAQAFRGQHTISQYGIATSGLVVWLRNVDCDGTENVLWDCFDEDEIGDIGNCQHINDASLMCAHGPCELAGYTETCCDPSNGVSCQGVDSDNICHCSLDCEDHNDCCIDYSLICRCNDYDLRLRDGTLHNEGRVEMCYKGEWGTVCDDSWNIADAKVVCRQLGYPTNGAQALSQSYFGQGTGYIWLDDVHCQGSETHLINCSANPIGAHDCRHYEDASVHCPISSISECTHGHARLVRGSSEYEGQLEVCYNGFWGTVCDDYFSLVDAFVACRTIFPQQSLGSVIFIQYSYEYFGHSTQDIVMDNVQCTGTEDNITDCYHITSHNCYHYEDVGLACYRSASYSGMPLLVPGPNSGRLIVYTSSSWGTVCKKGFGVEDAKVVCRELSQPTGSPRVYRDLQFGQGFGSVKYTQVSCSGNETHLNNCSKNILAIYCYHNEDVGIGCEESCANGQVRLVGGQNTTEGRVEICYNGTWGTICDYDSSWGAEEAHVVCKQLGLPYAAAQASSYNQFGPGPDPYHFSNVQCDGDENNISLCSKSTNHMCTTHAQDVGVVCLGLCTPGNIRLVGGTTGTNGRLEICLGGLWGTVCDEQFDNVDAKVVCRQLGFPYAGAEAQYGALFGEGNDHIAITSLNCQGYEEQILSCFFLTGSAVTCSHANDVGVVCQELCVNGDIRLSGGETANAGRIEICYNGNWGTICDKGWNANAAKVVCTQLGFESTYVRTYGGSKYGPGFGRIYFRDIECTGNETSLFYCPGNINTTGCDHTDDAGLSCDGGYQMLNNTTISMSFSLPFPGLVHNVTVTSINSTSVLFNWTEPVNEQSIITGYEVTVNGISNFLLGNQRKTIISDLKPGIPYMYYIAASNIFGTGTNYSNTFFSVELAPNSAVNLLSGKRIDEYTILISWKPLNLIQARGHITSYVVELTVYNQSMMHTAFVSANITNFTTPWKLLPSKQYSVTVLATTSNGTGPPTYPSLIIDTTSSAYFELNLNLLSYDMCGSWTVNKRLEKIQSIVTTVALEVNSRCRNCSLGRDHFDNERFHCDSAETSHVIFIAQLFSPGSVTNVTMLGYLLDWLTSGNSTLAIDGIEFQLDMKCNPHGITGFDNDFCAVIQTTASNFQSIGIGVGVAVLVISSSILLILLIVCCKCRIKGNHPIRSQDASSFSKDKTLRIGKNKILSQYVIGFSKDKKHNIVRMGTNDDDFDDAIALTEREPKVYAIN